VLAVRVAVGVSAVAGSVSRSPMLRLMCSREAAPMRWSITTGRFSIDDIYYRTACTPVIRDRHTSR
jgi:hypothetical protein